jgi:hypothetical protein
MNGAVADAIERACLENPRTVAYLVPSDARPDEYEAIVSIHNGGPGTAAGVTMRIGAPDGMVAEGMLREIERSFESLGANETIQTRVMLRLVASVSGEYASLNDVRVACETTPQYILPAAACRLRAQGFDAGSGLSIDGEGEVAAGDRVVVRFHAKSAGYTLLRDVRVRLAFPDSLHYVPDSARLNGAPVPQHGRTRNTKRKSASAPVFSVPYIDPGDELDVEAQAYAWPAGDVEDVTVTADVRWDGGCRNFASPLTIRAVPVLTSGFNRIELDGPVDRRPGETVAFKVSFENYGTSCARGVRVAVDAPDFTEQLPADAVDIGTLEQGERRSVEGRVRVPDEIEDGARLRIAAHLRADEDIYADVRPVYILVRSAPFFDPCRCRLEIEESEPLRPGRRTAARLFFVNDGTATARNLRAELTLPPGMILAGNGPDVWLGEIAPRGTAETEILLALEEPLHGRIPIRVRLFADGMLPTPLDPLWVEAVAEPHFVATCTLRSGEAIGLGDTLAMELEAVNCGDGIAKRLSLYAQPLDCAAYVCGTTTVNGLALVDGCESGFLHSRDGLRFENVPPGTRLHVGWALHAHDVAQAVAPQVRLAWDGAEATISTTPFDVGPLSEARNIEELPFRVAATVRRIQPNVHRSAQPADAQALRLELRILSSVREELTELMTDIASKAFVGHVLTLRALFPASCPDGAVDAALQGCREAWRGAMDRLFIRLRIPDYAIGPRDIMDRRTHLDLVRLLEEVAIPHRQLSEPSHDVLRTNLDLDDVRATLEGLKEAAAPGWRTLDAIAMLIPTASENDARLESALRAYRTTMRTRLSTFESVEPEKFYRCLHEPAPRDLDEARAGVLHALVEGR